jgi:hypothetical protein
MVEMRNAHLKRKPVGNKPLERPSCRWYDNIEMDHNEIRWEVIGWIHLAQGRH